MRVIKRNGQEVEFDKQKIIDAMTNAFMETEEGIDEDLIQDIADEIEEEIGELVYYPTVESIQDMVEEALMSSDRKDVAKRYILYRDERTVARNNKKNKYEYLDSDFLSFYKHKEDPFPNELGKFVYYRTYSRPIPSEQRRERWYETVARVVDFNIGLQVDAMRKQGKHITESVMSQLKVEAKEIYDAMYNLKLFPSGRTLWVGNTTPSKVFPLSNFNCSFLTIDSFIKFSEMFFVLMLGTGVGLSVTKEHVDKLPKVNTKIDIIHKDYILKKPSDRIEHTELRVLSKSVLEIVVGDSKSGWSKAIEFYFDIITSKQYADIEFILMNYDNIRPAGERLKTFGGFASGHNAIKIMFEKIQDIFRTKANPNSQWYKVTSLNCLDIATNIAENVVSGGTRRSALIVFCDKDDYEVREAKSNLYYQNENGQWIANEKMLNRMLSNNTILYDGKPSRQELKEHFELLKVTGEPSFGNLEEMKRRREDVQGGNPLT